MRLWTKKLSTDYLFINYVQETGGNSCQKNVITLGKTTFITARAKRMSLWKDCSRIRKNLNIAWIDYYKAFDSVPHSLKEILTDLIGVHVMQIINGEMEYTTSAEDKQGINATKVCQVKQSNTSG
jgi:hypothetical protein